MDRRRFLLSGLSAFTCHCSFTRAFGDTGISKDCRAAASASKQLADDLRQSSGHTEFDQFCRNWHSGLVDTLALRPGFSFFNDGDQPNALATPAKLLPEGPDGTVLLGISLLNHELSSGNITLFSSSRSLEIAYPSIAIILAHEFGHILQYKSGMTRMALGRWNLMQTFLQDGFWPRTALG